MLALRLPKKLLFVVVLEGLAVNMKSLITLIFLLHAGFIYADNDKKLFEGINDVVRLNFSDGSYYIGQVGECLINLKKSTCMNGVGIYSTISGYSFAGLLIDNKPNGYGLFTSPDGQIYQGEFKKGKLHGKGTMNYPDGRRYEGDYKNNNRDGYGVMVYPENGMYQEGSRYEGEWRNDKRHGQGIMTYQDDGRSLKGGFKENVFIGN